jgi:hypothetical protein
LTVVLWMLIGCEALVLLLWMWGLAWIRSLHADQTMQVDPERGRRDESTTASLTVLIAAHNEQCKIETCLRSLLSQDYPNMRVIVANDRSEDGTSIRVRNVMAEDARVGLVEIGDLPHGWVGKTHALSVACVAVDADYMLFMDCDCQFVPGAIAAVMQKVTSDGIEFASLMPSLELRSPAERLLTPPACWLLGLWAMLGVKRGEPNSEIRLGNGQFMLFSRAAYQKVGGHASVKAELAEDLTLADKAAELGLRRWIGMGKGLYVTSRDNTLSGTVNSLTRVLIGSIVKPWRILLSPHLLFGGVAAPLWILPLAAYCVMTMGTPAAWAVGVMASLHVLIMYRVMRRLFGMVLEESPSIWAFMVGSFVTGILVHWTWLVTTGRGHVRWGKTAYRVRGSCIVDVFPDAGQSVAAS